MRNVKKNTVYVGTRVAYYDYYTVMYYLDYDKIYLVWFSDG